VIQTTFKKTGKFRLVQPTSLNTTEPSASLNMTPWLMASCLEKWPH